MKTAATALRAGAPGELRGARVKKRKMTAGDWRNNVKLYGMLLPVLVHIFIFCYRPMYGILIAFQDYAPGSPFLSFDGRTTWVGLKHFTNFVQDPYFFRIVRNTVRLNLLSLAFAFCTPIIFALLINEVRHAMFKKVAQTVSYMPHFISSVIIAGMVHTFLNGEGIINQFFALFGVAPRNYLLSPQAMPIILVGISIWTGFGWGSILYLSNISSIDPALYESARLDGANRWQQMWHITLPFLRNLIMINLIFAVGGLMGSSGDMILNLYNPVTYETADVIATYVYRQGLEGMRYSSSTAINLFVTVINFILLVICNKITNKVADFGLW